MGGSVSFKEIHDEYRDIYIFSYKWYLIKILNALIEYLLILTVYSVLGHWGEYERYTPSDFLWETTWFLKLMLLWELYVS